MLGAIYDFFYRLLVYGLDTNTYWPYGLNDFQFDFFGETIEFGHYLTLICSLVTFFFIFVLCCLFIWKIVKLLGGLIR